MGLPLQGLRVIDLTKDFAGPFCTMMLSDLGAEVIKVEKPGLGDETRAWGPPFINGLSYYFLSLNRRKKSITLNLKSLEAQKIVKQLVSDADVLVESFRPGTLARYRLDYQSLRRANKALIYCSISGFGQTGPYRLRPGYDIVAFAMSGIMSTTGEEGRPSIRVSVPVADIAAGHYATTAILASLAKRLVTGRGDCIDISLLDSIVSWLTYNATYYFATGKQPLRMGSAHPSIVPYQAFNCKDRELVVAVGNDEQWKAFCQVMGLEEMVKDGRYATNPSRVHNRRTLIPELSRLFKRKKAGFWHQRLVLAGVPSTPVYTIADVSRDPQVRFRRMFVAAGSVFRQMATPMRFLRSETPSFGSVPKPGQHSEAILKELGYSMREIRILKTRGSLG